MPSIERDKCEDERHKFTIRRYWLLPLATFCVRSLLGQQTNKIKKPSGSGQRCKMLSESN